MAKKKAHARKRAKCKCKTLQSCVEYVRKAYGTKRRFARGKAAAAERRMSALYNG
jgi:hypothetical protein